MNEFTNRVPDATVRRLSLYLRFLEDFERSGVTSVASGALAERGGTTAAQVRKDLSYLGSFGKRGLGYSVAELNGVLRGVLGLDTVWRVALLGAGRIGTALFEYEPFRGARLQHHDRDRQRSPQGRDLPRRHHDQG